MKLKIVADDFGATQGVNEAIVLLHKKGIINHTALMPCGKAFQEAILKISQNPSLKIGLHFVLSEEKSLTNGKSITNNGYFYSRETLLKKAFLNQIKKQEIYNELYAQYLFLKEKNIKVSFINGHRHIHIFPIIRDIVLNFAKEKNLEVRVPDEPLFLSKDFGLLIKKSILKFLAKSFKKIANNIKIKTNDYFISNWCLNNPEFSIDETKKLLKIYCNQKKYKNKVLEYMVHPAIFSDDLINLWLGNEIDAKKREDEFNMLFSNEFREFIYNNFEEIL